MLWPGPPLISLNGDTTSDVGVGFVGNKTVFHRSHEMTEPTRVSKVLLLEPSEGAALDINTVDGSERFKALLSAVRGPNLFKARRRRLQLKVTSELANLPMSRAIYDRQVHPPEAVASMIASWILES